jgi:hypothetical protein
MDFKSVEFQTQGMLITFECKNSDDMPATVNQHPPAPNSTPQRMNGKWLGNSFLMSSSSLAIHGG